MSTLREALPDEGDEEEARTLVSRHPVRLPTYKLERIHVATLNVDYAQPHGSGYARPLSPHRLKQLREEWDPLAVSALTLSRRNDNTLWIIDGNHRRYVAYEKGLYQLPALVHSNLSRAQEADLYTKLGTVLGQTPATRFQAKVVSGDQAAADLVRIADHYGFTIVGTGNYVEGNIAAVARAEYIYARGGPDGWDWVLGLLSEAFEGRNQSLASQTMEGAFGFYIRYADRISRGEVARVLKASGMWAWHNRAAGVYDHIDVGNHANTYGYAIQEMVNQTRPKKNWLPAWEKISQFGSRYREVAFKDRGYQQYWTSIGGKGNFAPQHLGTA
jgi:hypothetical protein